MKLRDWSLRRWALVIALIILLPLVAMRLHLRWRLNEELDQLRAEGVPLSLQELAETYRASAEAIQAGAVLTNIYWRLPHPTEEEEPDVPGVGDNRDIRPGAAMPETMRQVTSNYLSRVVGLLPELYAALERPEIRYDREYNELDGSLDGYESGLTRNAVKILYTEFLYALDQAEWHRAAQAAAAQLRIVRSLHAEPGWIGQMNRMALLQFATASLELILGRQEVEPRSFSLLRQALEPRLDCFSLAHAVAGERALFLELAYRNDRSNLEKEFLPLSFEADYEPGELSEMWERFKVLVYRMSGKADEDIAFYIRASRGFERVLRGSLHEQHQLAANWNSHLPAGLGLRFHFWSGENLDYVGKVVEHHVARQSKLLAADAALAVAQYRLQHDGKLPASIEELVPEFLEAVPAEPQSGQPFELIVTADGYGIGRGTPVFKVRLNSPAKEEPE
jgi:hypothetical protein